MNLDEYYLNEAYNHEDSKEYSDKVWLVVFDKGEESVNFGRDYNAAERYYTEEVIIMPLPRPQVVEIGWIYETNLCSDYYKYFNPVKP